MKSGGGETGGHCEAAFVFAPANDTISELLLITVAFQYM